MGYTSMKMSVITLGYFFMVFVTFTSILNPIFASRICEFPAIFNLGASSADTGTLSAAFTPLNSPYGDTYFHMPAGRYSDGRLIIDFIAKSFNLPFLSAYLNSLGASYTHGANFASARATIGFPSPIIPTNGGYSPFYLDVQYQQFMQFKERSQIIRKQGGKFAKLMPEEEYFREALYTFDFGLNDIGAAIFSNMSIEEVKANIPDIVNTFSIYVKNIYESGGRSFWIQSVSPIGCLPVVLTAFPSAEKDSAGCAKQYNEVARYFNYKLKEVVSRLRKDLPLAALTYVDMYPVKYSLISEAKKYGFELPLIACCGYGGKYNYSDAAQCGETITVNNTKMFVGSCDNPSVRVNWDGIHYTDAANKFVFDRISTGEFSDPPIPLSMACHRNA